MTHHIRQWKCDRGGQDGGEGDCLEPHGFLQREIGANLREAGDWFSLLRFEGEV